MSGNVKARDNHRVGHTGGHLARYTCDEEFFSQNHSGFGRIYYFTRSRHYRYGYSYVDAAFVTIAIEEFTLPLLFPRCLLLNNNAKP